MARGEFPTRYAFALDVAMLRALEGVGPLERVLSRVARASGAAGRSALLRSMIRVGPDQLQSLHLIAESCAAKLGMAAPAVYVANDPALVAFAAGSDGAPFVVVNAGLVDHLDEAELRFVIGREFGHIQNRHLLYGAALRWLERNLGARVPWTMPAAVLALSAWSRRAEVTADRAGLLCAGEGTVPARALLKMACGSKKLVAELNVDAYLRDLEASEGALGRFAELRESHPYLPKRILALRVFEQSALYRKSAGLGSGDSGTGVSADLSMEEVDERTEAILSVLPHWRR
jgi:Zn-dependent protease with chaperone function